MEEKKIHLSNGDSLIRTEEGIYFISHGENGTPLLIEQEEGESLLIETIEQLKAFAEEVTLSQDLIRTWHCDSFDCEGTFYLDFNDEPSHCPYCGGIELSDSKILVTNPLNIGGKE